MADSTQNAEAILHAIKLTQKLRASVTKVFTNLADGFAVTDGNEKALLNEFQKSLLAVNNDFSELEKVGGALPPPVAGMPNSSHLSIDPATDKSPVYSQILQAYKWTNKVSELAGYASAMLDPIVKVKRTLPTGGSIQAKRLRRVPQTSHVIHPNMVDAAINKIRSLTTDISIVITRPIGSCAILQMTLGRILKAQVSLRGLLIEWVNIRGFEEENTDESKLELWAKSRFLVFQKVTESAKAATLHFYCPNNAEIALHSFTVWLQSFKTLFSAPCVKCGKHYLAGLPPTWRDVRTLEAYHDACKQ